MQEREEEALMFFRRARPWGDGGFEEICFSVVVGETVAGTGDEVEELGDAVEEIEGLGDEEEEQGFGKVAEDAADGEDHAGEIAVGVADEDGGGVPVVGEQGERDADEGEEHVEGEEMGDEEEGDDEGLGNFDAIDAGENVDAVGAENGNGSHVDVVERAELEELAEIGLQGDGDDDLGDAEIDKVDD
ncbi:hypothetical protein BGAL_0098g00030 [Botrytis galanthina]|uniref:Uncharacterized protein n=1 Tax=Botrytis galanthina TaxID=278940 RepID=A0A4S8R1W9_9HELO|nr:hypothetical protein BGAL_0098g00030 [Botrytis galanthina]